MSVPAYQLKPTPQEYLEGEQYGDVRHEYSNGDVYAMRAVGWGEERPPIL